jgi:hypothetical protein
MSNQKATFTLKDYPFVRKFFLNYIWIGIVLILISIIISLEFPDGKGGVFINLSYKTI